ncbi:hypothetical protein CS0771_58610 [Catellatospora sp. IY07-71]|uniref:hypothetical protein n=1 Tax=Catellatospora sp. IY07-71 TaxID=2728827 RepID=UPI001BB3C9B5|nr:hypothetical protein [Catellatospora sp. IY07-71]BCJ76317.1 hypothetical protein CS0771_58610 [Catellatospora sp. IY07-71]
MSRKSYYDLAFGVAAGGSHKDAHYIRGTLDEIKADLAVDDGSLSDLGARPGDTATDDDDYVPYGFTDFEG